MRESLAATDPKALMKTWMSGMGEGFEEMQKQFWSQFTGQNTKDRSRPPDSVMTDTIFALSTAAGRAGIAVIEYRDRTPGLFFAG